MCVVGSEKNALVQQKGLQLVHVLSGTFAGELRLSGRSHFRVCDIPVIRHVSTKPLLFSLFFDILMVKAAAISSISCRGARI